MSSVSIASIRNLTVRYGRFTALDNFSVEVPSGCVGLLGPNGAGKTTLIKTLLGFIDAVAGEGTVLGHNIKTEGRFIRQKLGLMPEQDCHIPGMSAVQFVAFAGELAGMPAAQALRRAHEVLEYCGLGEARYRNVETYSTGMKQRIKLAQALIHGPKLLLLDEPTNGLDPQGREDMLELVRSITHEKDLNVIVSSHLLPDIERICDHVIVVVGGKLRTEGLIKDLKKIEGHPCDLELREFHPEFPKALEALGVAILEQKAHKFRIQAAGTPDQIAKVAFTAARQVGAQIREFGAAERSLEDAFLEAIR